jgi:hypothetical protein
MNEHLKGRKLQGLAPAGPDFVVVTALPESSEKAPPMIAYLARVSNYAEFRDGLLKPKERKALTTAAATPAGGTPSYLGAVVQLQAERGGFQLWVPGTAARDLYKTYEPMFRK